MRPGSGCRVGMAGVPNLAETAALAACMGAALTYARRYALFTLVGIAGEDDLDAPDLNGKDEAIPNVGSGVQTAALPMADDPTSAGTETKGHPRQLLCLRKEKAVRLRGPF